MATPLPRKGRGIDLPKIDPRFLSPPWGVATDIINLHNLIAKGDHFLAQPIKIRIQRRSAMRWRPRAIKLDEVEA